MAIAVPGIFGRIMSYEKGKPREIQSKFGNLKYTIGNLLLSRIDPFDPVF